MSKYANMPGLCFRMRFKKNSYRADIFIMNCGKVTWLVAFFPYIPHGLLASFHSFTHRLYF